MEHIIKVAQLVQKTEKPVKWPNLSDAYKVKLFLDFCFPISFIYHNTQYSHLLNKFYNFRNHLQRIGKFVIRTKSLWNSNDETKQQGYNNVVYNYNVIS